jgi:hypothetical protein
MYTMELKIIIAKDFSPTPGARYYTDGPFSGEEFYDKLLSVKFNEALESGRKLVVDLDGTEGYATSFLDEAFRRLAKHFSINTVMQNLEIISTEEPDWREEVFSYIEGANE